MPNEPVSHCIWNDYEFVGRLLLASLQFQRPTNSRFIRIIREDGREVVTIDVAISPSVMYPEGSLRRELKFITDYQFTERMQYYVLLDPGTYV